MIDPKLLRRTRMIVNASAFVVLGCLVGFFIEQRAKELTKAAELPQLPLPGSN